MADETQTSQAVTVPQAADHLATLTTADEVNAYVEGDDRKGVQDAAAARLTQVAPPANPTATTSSDAVRLGLPDGPASKPGKPLEESGSQKVTVRTRWPIDRFEHGLQGVEVIEAHGTEVSRSHAAKLNELAAKSGIELEEIA